MSVDLTDTALGDEGGAAWNSLRAGRGCRVLAELKANDLVRRLVLNDNDLGRGT